MEAVKNVLTYTMETEFGENSPDQVHAGEGTYHIYLYMS